MTQEPLFNDPSWTADYPVGSVVVERHLADEGIFGVVIEQTDDDIVVEFSGHPYFGGFACRYGGDAGLVMFDDGRSEPAPAGLTTTGDHGAPASVVVPAVVPTNDDDPGAATPRPSIHPQMFPTNGV